MTWQRNDDDMPDPYVVALAIIDAAVAASVDADIVGTTAVRTMPAVRPAKIVQVRIDDRTASTQGLVDVALVSYRVWHTTRAKREELARFVHAALLGAPTSIAGARVSRAESILRPLDVTDPQDVDTPTYFGRVELSLRP